MDRIGLIAGRGRGPTHGPGLWKEVMTGTTTIKRSREVWQRVLSGSKQFGSFSLDKEAGNGRGEKEGSGSGWRYCAVRGMARVREGEQQGEDMT